MVITRKMKVRAMNKLLYIIKSRYGLQDPISLDRIRKKFVLVRNNCTHYYDASTLYDYIISTGDYTDPISRIEYDDCELLRLENVLKITPHTLKNEKKKLIKQRKEYFNLMGLCDVFETDILEQIELIMNEVEHEDIDTKLRTEIIPFMIESFENYRSIHTERCLATLRIALKKIQEKPIPKIYIHLSLCHIIETLIFHCS